MDIIVKIDGDDQMDPEEIIDIINPLFEGYDYAKGNRFLNNQNIENPFSIYNIFSEGPFFLQSIGTNICFK